MKKTTKQRIAKAGRDQLSALGAQVWEAFEARIQKVEAAAQTAEKKKTKEHLLYSARVYRDQLSFAKKERKAQDKTKAMRAIAMSILLMEHDAAMQIYGSGSPEEQKTSKALNNEHERQHEIEAIEATYKS